MPSHPLPSKTITELPPIVTEHLAAVNAFDTDRIVNTFAPDAYVNDSHREIWGADAIWKFMDKEFVGDHVTMEVREILDHHGDIIVRARYDGTWGWHGLTDIHHVGRSPGKDVQYGDRGKEEAASPPFVYPGVQGWDRGAMLGR